MFIRMNILEFSDLSNANYYIAQFWNNCFPVAHYMHIPTLKKNENEINILEEVFIKMT